jgi:hypothetical protein
MLGILRFILGIYFKVEISTFYFRNYFDHIQLLLEFWSYLRLIGITFELGVILECEDTFFIVELLLN